jgi:hypothetical protein
MMRKDKWILFVVLAGALLTGCTSDEAQSRAEKAAIEQTIRSYLPRLSTAYATGDVEPLKAVSVPKEVSRVRRRRNELNQQGKLYEPSFKELTVESISTWKNSNAYVTTVEVWDVRSYTLGTRILLSEVTDQRNRVKYQLKLQGRDWVVLYRELAGTLSQDLGAG